MDWFPDNDDSDFYIFEPESFTVPPMEGFLRRVFGARWGLILVSAPESMEISSILDFLASYSLRLEYYSEFSTKIGDFHKLEKDEPRLRSIKEDEPRLRTIEEVLEEAEGALPEMNEGTEQEEDMVRHIPRNPEIVFIPNLSPDLVPATVESAMSGRLVVSGIHAEGSFPALQYFRELVGSDHLAASSLMGILGLNMVERICPECKTMVEYELDDDDLLIFGKGSNTVRAFKGMGCESCKGKGYQDRILICEGFELSENIRAKILESLPPRQLRIIAKKEGMRTLLDATWDLAESGETTLDEVARIANLTDPG